MYFSSLIFMFLYLPAVIAVYHLAPRRCRNAFLLIVNIIFYGWGEPVFILVMFASIIVNYIFGLLIEKHRDSERLSKAFVLLSVIISLGLLGVFKYAGFISDLLRRLPLLEFLPRISIPLPIGISFYTFQTMSYVIDVYRGDTKAQKSLINFGTYVSFFPQLIAGPIVRYKDIEKQLVCRAETIDKFASGARRFTVGLVKKVLIANQMGVLWDSLRPIGAELGAAGAWIGVAAYSFQIYFDFSGYSDMAIGLGRMFGFEFMENFNYPYISKSITEFWRRWHISLSSWFRDYVYIPLGGNRCGAARHIFNMLVVWSLTGLWHGANLNFVMWGIYYFVLLALEKYVYGRFIKRLPSVFGHIYTLFFVILGWTIFVFTDPGELFAYLGYMFGAGAVIGHDALSLAVSYAPLLAAAALASLPVWKRLYAKLHNAKIMCPVEMILILAALVLCTASLVSDSYNPFLYFRF